MASYRKKLSAAKSIVSCFRILFRRIGQNPKSPAVIDTAGDSGAVDETINQDTEPPPLPDDVLQARPPSPHECPGLNSEGMEIHGYLRAGIFVGIWDGSPESAPLVFESYLLNSTADPTYPRAMDCKGTTSPRLSHRNIVPSREVYTTREMEDPPTVEYDRTVYPCLGGCIKEIMDLIKIRLFIDIILHHMHNLGVVHGNLEINDTLVNPCGTARIVGLETALVGTGDDRACSGVNTESPPYGTNPKLVLYDPPGFTMQITKGGEACAFAWALFAGYDSFPKACAPGAVYSLAIGDRLPQPVHLSGKTWDAVKGSRDNDPSLHPSIRTAVAIPEEKVS